MHRAPPKRPVLDWADLRSLRDSPLPSLADLPHQQLTTSGRAAIYHALRLAAPEPGSPVLVPTYHCPTMIAPVVLSGHEPVFYPIDHDGHPLLEAISLTDARRARCILAPHYFGITRSFAELRAWCDATETLLIEDCAHAFYGIAGDRPVGTWGDYATASLTKFFPILEGGLLASARRPVPSLPLRKQPFKSELKAVFDLAHISTEHGRLQALRPAIEALRKSRKSAAPPPETPSPKDISPDPASTSPSAAMQDSDMARIELSPLASTRWILKRHPQDTACARRQVLFTRYAAALHDLPGARPMHAGVPARMAPYAFPLWVDDAEAVYQALRLAGVPVYRWDRVWPGTPELREDQGPIWRTHVLQLLCHQSLSDEEIAWTLTTIQETLQPDTFHTHV